MELQGSKLFCLLVYNSPKNFFKTEETAVDNSIGQLEEEVNDQCERIDILQITPVLRYRHYYHHVKVCKVR